MRDTRASQAQFVAVGVARDQTTLFGGDLLPVKKGPSGFVVGLARFSSVLLVEWVPCLRVGYCFGKVP